jgi:hypothetical protein
MYYVLSKLAILFNRKEHKVFAKVTKGEIM